MYFAVIVPILLDALSDPSRKTATCLKSLLGTKFVHFIDAPSLGPHHARGSKVIPGQVNGDQEDGITDHRQHVLPH